MVTIADRICADRDSRGAGNGDGTLNRAYGNDTRTGSSTGGE